MNALNHVGAALASVNALESESEGMLVFFDTANRARAEFGWGPRQRRRDRIRRRNA